MKAVGVFGGSFDPIHLGHLITSYDVLEKRNLEKIIFVPCHISPHKEHQVPTDDAHRLNMIKLAIEHFPFFEVNDYEIRQDGISYTLNTLIELKKYYSNIELIIGFDNLLVFESWYQPDEILKIAKLVVMKREPDNAGSFKNKYFESAIILDTVLIDISSTEIRSRIINNESIDYLVPTKVKDYIEQQGLYK
jgi:nicotinate-nucleotide adenylyltransferase